MASLSTPSSPPPSNPNPPSSLAVEEEAEVIPSGKFLPVLKLKEADFQILMTKVQMPAEFRAVYPQQGDTVGAAPGGYVECDWYYCFGALEHPRGGKTRLALAPAVVPLKTLGNKELQFLRMMLRNKPRHKTKLVLKENNKGKCLCWLHFGDFFRTDFEGKLEVVDCDAGEAGWLVSDTLEGLGVLRSSSCAGGANVGAKPVAGQKRKEDTVAAGESKASKFRRTRTVVLSTHMPTGFIEEEKKTVDEPEIEIVSSEGTPTAQNVEGLFRDPANAMIVDTIDASDNLIDSRKPHGDAEGEGGKKTKSPIQDNISSSGAAGKGHQLASLLVEGSIVANAILEDWDSLARREEEAIRLKEEATALVQRTQVVEKRLNKQKAEFEAYKKTEQWAAFAGLKQARSLTNLLAEKRKLWKEACARENEKFYLLLQELKNLKAANATLAKEKAAADATIAELAKEKVGAEAAMKEAEARGAAVVKELANANAGRSSLLKTVEDLKMILGDVNRRLGEAEARARKVEEERDGLATSNAQLIDDHAWMREFGVVNIVNAILVARENIAAVANVNECAREAGFKAGYNHYLNDVNALSSKQFTDERCALRGVDTEAAYSAATEAYNGLIIPALEQIEACLEVDDYVGHLRRLFEPRKDGEGTSGGIVE
ncbi:hypothetical protein Hanom_Chr10g00910651 [Helianthus anomalus]